MSTDDIVPNVCGSAPSLRAIDKVSVHKICSGQVILTLASAVKELVENSLDAGSTSIEVRLREYGAESIEVIDNGSGVCEKNFQALTLKHYTSKLTDFQDIVGLDTFGFRGEALSSLCALSELSIVTFHQASSPTAFKLDYDNQGNLIGKTACSRQQGTTVTIRNIFSTLPVRHKEFLKHVRREFAKMLNVLYAYCLTCSSVRIFCSNQVGDKRSTILATQNGSSVKDNIACIFGQKQLTSLLEFQFRPPDSETLTEYSLQASVIDTDAFVIRGYVSSCQRGCGRSAPDRQFYYINRRPCDPTKLSRLINDVYRSFNRNQHPFVYMDITLRKESVDVNVTPDKRQIFTDNDNMVLAVVKSSLSEMYSSVCSAIGPAVCDSANGLSPVAQKNSSDQPTRNSFASPPTNLQQFKRTFSFVDSAKSPHRLLTNVTKQPRLENFAFKCNSDKSSSKMSLAVTLGSGTPEECKSDNSSDIIQADHEIQKVISPSPPLRRPSISPETSSPLYLENPGHPSVEIAAASADACLGSPTSQRECTELAASMDEDFAGISSSESDGFDDDELLVDETRVAFTDRPTVTVTFSLADIASRLRSRCGQARPDCEARKFRAKITPADNSAAEDELTRQISKDSFAGMEIIGQFNMGFIVTRYESDLFIIDQHASDEKYNFEDLQRSDVPRNQRLIIPQPLWLNAVHQTILLDNLDVFRRNGFQFDLRETNGTGQEGGDIKLVSVPVSKGWVFGKSDVEEMLFMLGDAAPGTMCRPSRLRQMYASRACRKSVFIGTALRLSEMRRLVAHMGQMEQPWTCPHGRPTMRHLVNLDLVKLD